MAGPPIQQMTLRELLTESERLARELIEHLERGFIPRVRSLGTLVRPTPTGSFATDIEDVSVRNSVAEVLAGDEFTEEICERLSACCDAIEREGRRIVSG